MALALCARGSVQLGGSSVGAACGCARRVDHTCWTSRARAALPHGGKEHMGDERRAAGELPLHVHDVYNCVKGVVILRLKDHRLLLPHVQYICAALRRNPRIRGVSLESCHLVASTLTPLLNAVVEHPNIEAVNLRVLQRNPIGNEGADVVAHLLGQITAVQSLNISECGVHDDGLVAMCEKLDQNRTLKQLELANNHLTSRGMNALSSMLRLNRTIEVLDVRHNAITNSAIKELSRALTCNTIIQGNKLSRVARDGLEVLMQSHQERTQVYRTLLLCGRADESILSALPNELMWELREWVGFIILWDAYSR